MMSAVAVTRDADRGRSSETAWSLSARVGMSILIVLTALTAKIILKTSVLVQVKEPFQPCSQLGPALSGTTIQNSLTGQCRTAGCRRQAAGNSAPSRHLAL